MCFPFKVDTLSHHRNTDNANIVWRQWLLDDFTDSDISTAFLTNIQEDFDVIRNSGFKAIVVFAYTDVQVRINFDIKLLKHFHQHTDPRLSWGLQENENSARLYLIGGQIYM